MNERPMTHASVFSGIGGAEVAATMLGWRQLFHCEINPFGRKVLDYWYPNSKSQAQKVSGKNLTVIDDEGETEQTNTGNQGGNGGGTQGGELEG